jgi:hypothetical protein
VSCDRRPKANSRRREKENRTTPICSEPADPVWFRSAPATCDEFAIKAAIKAGLSDRITESSTQPSTGAVIFDPVNRRLTRTMNRSSLPKWSKNLSRPVYLRAARRIVTDARTATYVFAIPSSGPGGRRFKSFRPDQSFKVRSEEILYRTFRRDSLSGLNGSAKHLG